MSNKEIFTSHKCGSHVSIMMGLMCFFCFGFKGCGQSAPSFGTPDKIETKADLSAPGMVNLVNLSNDTNFGTNTLTSSSAKRFEIKNLGSSTLTLSDISDEGLELVNAFTLASSSTCQTGKKLRPDESCNLDINFTPLMDKTYNCNAIVKFRAMNKETRFTIAMTGIGVGTSSSATSGDPVDNGANVQFSASFDNDGDDIGVTWTAFTDDNLSHHLINFYTDAACIAGQQGPYNTSSTNANDNGLVDSVPDGTYYATVTAVDSDGNTTTSACSSGTVIVDTTAPTGGGSPSFSNPTDGDGEDIALSWNAYTDANLDYHEISLFTDSSCTTGEIGPFNTNSDLNTDNGAIDGVPDGTYYAQVVAYDIAGNATTSGCSNASGSGQTIAVDGPPSAGSAPVFTDDYDTDGDNIAMTWTAFSDTTLDYHEITLYTDSACSLGMQGPFNTGSSVNNDNLLVDGIPAGKYYATVTAYDASGNSKTSPCSTDYIRVILRSFKTTWTTNNSGFSGTTQIKLPLWSSGDYNFVVNWGDGTSHTITSWNQADTLHNYSTSGTYTVEIVGIISQFIFDGTGDKDKLVDVEQWGDIVFTDVKSMFEGCTNLITFTAADTPNLSEVTEFNDMFRNATNFTGVGSTIGSWDTSKITSMAFMFNNAASFNADIGSWDTSQVTSFYYTFGCASAFDQDISNWDTLSALNMSDMFRFAASFNRDLIRSGNKWNTSNVTNMNYMFQGATSFNGDISNWDTSSLTTTAAMFDGAINFNQNIGNWNVSGVTDMFALFRGATAFNQNIGSWNVENVSNMNEMFKNASSFSQDLSSWTTTSLDYMTGMFYGASTFNSDLNFNTSGVSSMASVFNGATAFNGNISGWDTSKVTSMGGMFWGASAFNGNIANWDTSSLTGSAMTSMFRNASSFNQNIGGWDVSGVSNMFALFDGASAFNNGGSADIGNWDVSGVINMGQMFKNAATFNQDLSSWTTTNLNVIDNMFNGASAFNSDLNFDTSGVTNMVRVFMDATSFNGDISSWDTSNVTTMLSLFYGASAFNQDISSWDVSKVLNMSTIFGSATSFNQNISSWFDPSIATMIRVTNMSSMFYGATAFNQDISAWDISTVTNIGYMFRNASSFDQDLSSWNFNFAEPSYRSGATAWDDGFPQFNP